MSDFEYSIKKMFKEDIVSEWGRKKVRKKERKTGMSKIVGSKTKMSKRYPKF